MVDAANYLYALFTVIGFGLSIVAIAGVVLFIPIRALYRRARTLLWKPEIGDTVMLRGLSGKETVEEIKGSQLKLAYYTPNNLAKNTRWTTREKVLFLRRSRRRRA